MAELVLQDIHKTYTAANGSRRNVLGGIDLTVEPGEFVVLVGPSGCGKTTLLKIIAGVVLPDPGGFTWTLDGEPITQPGPDRGAVFQQYHSYPWLSVLQDVECGLQFIGVPKRERRERAEEQLKVVGLLEYRDEYPIGIVGRPAATGRHRAHPCRSPARDPDGRAVRGTRRTDARNDAGGAAPTTRAD